MKIRSLLILFAFWPTIASSDFQFVTGDVPKPADMKTNTIYYSDHTIAYTQWTGIEKDLLNLHGDYKEPDIEESHDGVRSVHHEALMMFVAKASFVVDRPADQIRLDRFLDKSLMQGLDHSVDVQVINPSDVITLKKPGMAFRNPPAREPQWCDNPNRSLCMKLHFNIPKILQPLLLTYFISQGVKDHDFDAESEVRILEPASLKNVGQLTGLSTPTVGAVSESFFWFTHMLQFGKVNCYLQPSPNDPQKTIVTGYIAFGIEQKWWNRKVGDVAVREVLMGNTFLNHGDGIIQGLPAFAHRMAAALAEQLQR